MAKTAATLAGASLDVKPGPAFESALEVTWSTTPSIAAESFKECVLEMVLDHAHNVRGSSGGSPTPSPDAVVKRVNIGTDRTPCIQNMPSGRHFLVAVVGKSSAANTLRSSWVPAFTLDPRNRKPDLVSLDPLGKLRRDCKACSCPGYVAFAWDANKVEKSRCRRCGCEYTQHVLVPVQEILEKRAAQARKQIRGPASVDLPPEAIDWDGRECVLWFGTNGAFHPRSKELATSANGESGFSQDRRGRPGLISVVTPTLETRQHFHRQLWGCFTAQTWPEKELVVVETYVKNHSTFLEHTARIDPRLKYYKFKVKQGADWSIGTKRNICAHVASGELLANFDDDDLYAPCYLKTMKNALDEQRAQAIKLSGWYVFDVQSRRWKFCDPIAWGLTKGHDENDQDVRNWAFGYGFSYVFQRQVGLECFYEDIDLGEDFNFISQLQRRKGEQSVALFHDDCGICVHIQHGRNTSDSIPLREVELREAAALEVMELDKHVGQNQENSAFDLAVRTFPPRRSLRVTAHLCNSDFRDVVVDCAVGATVAELLKQLEEKLGGPAIVYRVPPLQGEVEGGHQLAASEEERDAAAAAALGLSFLAELPGAAEHLRPDTKSGRQWLKLLAKAKGPLEASSRLDLRTRELWVLPAAAPAASAASGCAEREIIVVQGAWQQSDAKTLVHGVGTFEVRLPAGADVGLLRFVLGRSLPPKAKVLCEGPRGDIITLRETDPVPLAIKVTGFRGSRALFVHMDAEQARIAMSIIKAFLKLPGCEQRLDQVEQEAGDNAFAYRLLLGRLYVQEVYPVICRHIGVPDDALDAETFPHLCGPHLHSGLDLSFIWLEVETLGRHWHGAEEAFQHVSRFAEEAKLPSLDSWPDFCHRIYEHGATEALQYVQQHLGEHLPPLPDLKFER